MGRTSKYQSVTYDIDSKRKWQCGVYLRLSREDGDKLESDSIANQRKIIDRFLEKNKDIEISDYYIDDGYTGSNFNRPSMMRLLDDIKSQKINCLIVKDLSRFGRNYFETGRYLEVVFPLLKLRFISVNDNIDSFKNPRSLQSSSVSFKNVMNDEYGKDISNKVRSSFLAKRKKGEYIGSFALYGYKKDPNDRHRLVIDEEAAENVRFIYQMFLDGKSIYNIALTLNKMGILTPNEYKSKNGIRCRTQSEYIQCAWSHQTIRRMLQNEMYIGNMVQGTYQTISNKLRKLVRVPKENYIIKEGTHDPIITKEIFLKAQDKFKRDTWQTKCIDDKSIDEVETGGIYTGYIKCADCGRAMQRIGSMQKNNSFYYYACGSYLQWKQCTKHTVRVKKLNNIVLVVLKQLAAIAVEFDSFINNLKNKVYENFTLERIRKEISSLEIQKEKMIKIQNDLYFDYKDGILNQEQYFSLKKDYELKLSETDQRIISLNDELSKNDLDKPNAFIENFKKYRDIQGLSKGLIADLVDMIYVEEDGGLLIEFNFLDEFKNAFELLKVDGEKYKALIEEVNKITNNIKAI